MRYLFAALAVMLLISPAMAQTTNTNNNQNNNHNQANADAISQLDFAANINLSQGGTNFNGGGNPNQPGSFGLPSFASGPCVGASWSAGVGLPWATIGGGASSLDIQCGWREYDRLNKDSADPDRRRKADVVDDELFALIQKEAKENGVASNGSAPAQQSGLPVASGPVQTADASPPRCANDAMSTAQKMAKGCK